MQKKLTITLDERVYDGLHRVVGSGKISRFIETLIRPHVLPDDIDEAYADMATDRVREEEALDWSEGLIARDDDDDDESW